VFARLLTFPNVLITGHQAFFTREALGNIAATTLANISAFERDGRALHEVSVDKLPEREPRGASRGAVAVVSGSSAYGRRI
jgi:D-lactate dehydrogenase